MVYEEFSAHDKYIMSISTAAIWCLIQRLSAASPQKNGRALSDRKYPKDIYVVQG